MKKIVMMLVFLMFTGISFSAIFDDFEDGDYTNNPAWWVSASVGDGLITNDPVRPNNLAWKAYGRDTAHQIISTDVGGVAWDSFDMSLEYKASDSGNFHGAWFLEPEAGVAGSFRMGLWHDTSKDPDARLYIIEYGPSVQDIRTWIPIGNIPRNQWLKFHSWYDIDSDLMISELRILNTDMLIGQVSITPYMNLSQAGDIDVLSIGIEETNWQYMDNVVLVPEPCSLILISCGCFFLRKKNRNSYFILENGKMKNEIKRLIIICAVIVLFGTGYVRAGIWTTLDKPGYPSTRIYGIDGSNIIGRYGNYYGDNTSDGCHGLLYNGADWTTIDKPGAIDTSISGIDGSNMVGLYRDNSGNHGFLYDGVSWTTIDIVTPGASGTYIEDIEGNTLVGVYSLYSDNSIHGFLYNTISLNWTTLDKPGATNTQIYGIEGSNLVGNYRDGSGDHGFLYDMITQNWTSFDNPLAVGTLISGIDGSNLVGWYSDGLSLHGFLYNGTGWTTLDMPGATSTQIYGIDGSNLIGVYTDAYGDHGFVYTIPEPGTISLFCMGGLILRKRK